MSQEVSQETADLVTYAEEILNGKLYFCAVFEIIKLMQYSHFVINFP